MQDREVGAVVNITNYRLTIHYLKCHQYKMGVNTDLDRLTIPGSIKVRVCRSCKPTLEDILTLAAKLQWTPNMGRELSDKEDIKVFPALGQELVDNIASNFTLGLGKIPRHTGHD